MLSITGRLTSSIPEGVEWQEEGLFCFSECEADSSSLEVCCLLRFFDFLLMLCAFTVFGGHDFAIFFDHGLTTVAFSVGHLARVNFHRSLDMLDELREGCMQFTNVYMLHHVLQRGLHVVFA